MDKPDLNKILRESGLGLERTGPVGVTVALAVRNAEGDVLDRLRDAGLAIREVVENKVIGSIRAERIEALKELCVVAEVELSQPLRPH